MRAIGVAVVCLSGCYTGQRATRDINAAWRGHASAELEARWGKATPVDGALVWTRTDHEVTLPSAAGHIALDPTSFDVHLEATPGTVSSSTTEVVARLDGAGRVVDITGPSLYLGKGPPAGANLRTGTLLGFHAGMGKVQGAETMLPSLGLYIGGMLGPRLGLVGTYTFVNGNDPDGYGMGMSWGMAVQYWPIARLWVRAGPAFVVAKDPVDGAGVDVGVTTGVSYAVVRGRVFVLDVVLDATVATGVAFGLAGVGVNIN